MTMREKMSKAMEYAELSDEMNEALFKPDAPASPRHLMLADAALDALMEPTVSMEAAGTATGETDSADGDVCKIFCAMIRAAKDGK